MLSTNKQSAEKLFRAAYERLKMNKPNNLSKGTPVTQNNVAREAGRDSTALKKDRYPILVLEIQAYIASQNEQLTTKRKKNDNRTRTQSKKLADTIQQRDKLASIVAAQESYIEELLDEIDRLKSGKTVNIGG